MMLSISGIVNYYVCAIWWPTKSIKQKFKETNFFPRPHSTTHYKTFIFEQAHKNLFITIIIKIRKNNYYTRINI